jgi:hypothetical protein
MYSTASRVLRGRNVWRTSRMAFSLMWGRASQKVLRNRRVNSKVAEDFVSFLRDERRSSSSEVIGDCPKEEGGLIK